MSGVASGEVRVDVDSAQRVQTCMDWLRERGDWAVVASSAGAGWVKLAEVAKDEPSEVCDMEVAAMAVVADDPRLVCAFLLHLRPRWAEGEPGLPESPLVGLLPRPWVRDDGSWDEALAGRFLDRLEALGARLVGRDACDLLALTAFVLWMHGRSEVADEVARRSLGYDPHHRPSLRVVFGIVLQADPAAPMG